MLRAAQKELIADDRRGSVDRLTDLVRRQHLQLLAALDDDAAPAAIDEVDPSGGADGRRVHVADAVETAAADDLRPAPRVDAADDASIRLREPQLVVVEQRRRNVRRTALDLPGHLLAVRDVTARRQGNRVERVATVAAHAVDEAAACHRGRDHVHGLPATLPDDVATLQVVAPGSIRGVDDDLQASAGLDDERSGPRRHLITLAPPTRLSGPLVQHLDERWPLVIPVDHERVAVNDRRRALAEAAACRHVAEVTLPQLPAVEVVAVDTARAERDEERLAVGCRRRRCVVVVRVAPLLRQLLRRLSLPEDLPRPAIETEHGEAVVVARELDPEGTTRLLLGWRHAIIDPVGLDRREDEDAVAPDDRRRAPLAGDLGLPDDVAIDTPLDRRIAVRSHTVGRRTSPLVPVVRS